MPIWMIWNLTARPLPALRPENRLPSATSATGPWFMNGIALEATESCYSPTSPPPYMAGAATIDVDPETGHITLLKYDAVIDCGTVINPSLARVQAEGGIVQAIGMALTENVQYTPTGRLQNNSFMQYRLPTRLDVGRSTSNSNRAMNPTVLSVPSPSVNWSSIRRHRPLPTPSTMQPAYGSATFPLRQKNSIRP